MDSNTKANSLMVFRMGKGNLHGPMVMCTKAALGMGKGMVLERGSIWMDQSTQASTSKTNRMEKVGDFAIIR